MTVETIHQTMLQNINDKFDKSDGSFSYDVTGSVAIEINKQEEKTDSIIEKVDVEKLKGDELTRFVFQRTGLKRREATYATTTVTIVGTPSAIINTGDLVAADDIFYEVVEGKTLDSNGTANVLVKCTVAGTIGNVPVGAINSFPVTLSNITSVTNTNAVTNGYEAESDESLCQRYYDKLQRPGKAGNKYHYREWALEVPGVGKVKVIPKFNGPLTIKVAIVDANGNIAPQTLLDNVRQHIESEMPFGVEELSVVSATELEINISGTFTLKSGFTWEEVVPNIEYSLTNYYKKIAFEDGLTYISHAQVGREILGAEGVEDYSNLLLNGSTGNIAIGELEIPIAGSVTNT